MIRVRTLAAAAAAVLWAGAGATPTAHAGGFGIPEIGVRRTAMGSIVGRPDDPSAIYHNPAGLILQHGLHVYITGGLSLLDTSFQLHSWDGSDKYITEKPGADGYFKPVKPSRAFGVIPLIAITDELIPDRLVLGVSAFVGNAQGASFASTAVTHYHLIDGYVVAPQAVVGAAYRVAPSLTLGATAGIVNIRIHGEQDVFPVIKGMDVSSIVGSSPRLTLDGSGWAPTWMIGAFGQPSSRVTWGATLTGRVDAALTGPVDIAFSDDSARPGGTLDGTQATKQLLPWGASAGLNVDVTPQVEVGGEGRYWLYRQYKDQVTELTGLSIVNELDSPKNYHDSWEVSGGVRVHDLASARGLELMCGAQFDSSPAPPETVSLSSPSFSHFGAHSGLRYAWDRYRVGASYIHYWYEVPTITDSVTSPPTNIRGNGSNNIFTLSLEAKL